MGWLQPVTLQGTHVRLEPLEPRHVAALAPVALDPELWRLTVAPMASEAELRTYVQAALRDRDAGLALPFATMDARTGRAVGSTRFANASARDRRVEIGWTWIGRDWQRTAINTEAKYLMLRHAFEVLHCARVELKTDALNERSRNAILRIGAKQEGILRRHVLTDTGRMRDTVYFSILDNEWPEVKRCLEIRPESA